MDSSKARTFKGDSVARHSIRSVWGDASDRICLRHTVMWNAVYRSQRNLNGNVPDGSTDRNDCHRRARSIGLISRDQNCNAADQSEQGTRPTTPRRVSLPILACKNSRCRLRESLRFAALGSPLVASLITSYSSKVSPH